MRRAHCACSALLVLVCVVACGPGDRDGGGDDDSGDGTGAPDSGPLPPNPDAGPTGGEPVVYAHSSTTLYKVNPDTFEVTLVGDFIWPQNILFDQMTDIAIDGAGEITGVSYDRVYKVDRATAACTYLADLSTDFNGLSWVPAGGIDANEEVLVGTTLDGSVWRVDPQTGATMVIGNYGGGWTSSGDIVSVDGFGTVATVNTGGIGSVDTLARIDLQNGATATPIPMGGGNTGMSEIWGVGFWKGKVFGFTNQYQFVLIDTATGAAQLVETGNVQWWGAGVTTEAPIVE
jgi:hypothetical protein